MIDRLRDLGVPVPEGDDDRAWRRLPLAALVPAAEGAASAGGEQPQAGEGDEDGQAVYSMRPDEDIAEVDLTHYSRRSFAPDEEEEEQE